VQTKERNTEKKRKNRRSLSKLWNFLKTIRATK
jgi:hypothetical protein